MENLLTTISLLICKAYLPILISYSSFFFLLSSDEFPGLEPRPAPKEVERGEDDDV